jgi:hypothetical protein
MRDMARGITPIVAGDNAESCTRCGHVFGAGEPVFVAGQSFLRTEARGHAVCSACKPATTRWGSEPEWRSFSCETCSRTVHYHYGRGYRCCSYRCAQATWTKQATERRSAARARTRVKQVVCAECKHVFTAKRIDARRCSPACRQRAHRAAISPLQGSPSARGATAPF